jgi:hypothetical protein
VQIRSNTRATKASANFAATHSWAHGFIQLPIWQDWWQNELRESVYSDEFVDAVESARSIKVSLVGGHDI